MKPLQTEFVKNEITYKILERTETRYFAELHSADTNAKIGYETGRIVKNKGGIKKIKGKEIHFDESESIIDNEKFGNDKFEHFHPDKNLVYGMYIQAKNYIRKPKIYAGVPHKTKK